MPGALLCLRWPGPTLYPVHLWVPTQVLRICFLPLEWAGTQASSRPAFPVYWDRGEEEHLQQDGGGGMGGDRSVVIRDRGERWCRMSSGTGEVSGWRMLILGGARVGALLVTQESSQVSERDRGASSQPDNGRRLPDLNFLFCPAPALRLPVPCTLSSPSFLFPNSFHHPPNTQTYHHPSEGQSAPRVGVESSEPLLLACEMLLSLSCCGPLSTSGNEAPWITGIADQRSKASGGGGHLALMYGNPSGPTFLGARARPGENYTNAPPLAQTVLSPD
ncbi:hypothetical protein SKAU_G00403510 [Synaphobranchus kaupii]|uniref:Uncharacterized protein n=1 Tax=Synaphobranchus kaupii TaxID=118154 RepID=A0A9Q1ICM0_SYNKA|nr:hypothetical protein SKAU_G00403510 [Synaphobranchus kaupii]